MASLVSLYGGGPPAGVSSVPEFALQEVQAACAIGATGTDACRINPVRTFTVVAVTPGPAVVVRGRFERQFQIAGFDVIAAGTGRATCRAGGAFALCVPGPFEPPHHSE